MMKKTAVLIGLALILGTPAFAEMSQQCIGNITLQRDLNYTFNTGSSLKNLTITKQEDCLYGCDNVTNRCAPNPAELTWQFGIAVLGLLFVIGLIVKVLR